MAISKGRPGGDWGIFVGALKDLRRQAFRVFMLEIQVAAGECVCPWGIEQRKLLSERLFDSRSEAFIAAYDAAMPGAFRAYGSFIPATAQGHQVWEVSDNDMSDTTIVRWYAATARNEPPLIDVKVREL